MNALEEFLASLRRLFDFRTRPPAEPISAPTSDRPPPEVSPPPVEPAVAEVRALLDAMAEPPVAAQEPGADVPHATAESLQTPALLDEPGADVAGPVSDLVGGALVLTLITPPATFTIARPTATLGRGADNTIRLDDLSVSRRHARIAYRRAGYWLSDLGSMGGTWVNGSRLAAPHEIRAGEIIDIGHCRLTVGYARDAAKVDVKVRIPSRRPTRR